MTPRVLLLTGVAPGRVAIGRIFLRDLCMLYPHDRICCFHTDPLPEDAEDPGLNWLPIRYAPRPREQGIARLGQRVQRLSRPMVERYVDWVRIPGLVQEAVAFGKQHKVEMVWATLHAPTTVRLAKPVADSLGVPLVTTVWDPPTYVIREGYRADHRTVTRILRKFAGALAASKRCGVASEAMRRRYQGEFGTECLVMVYPSHREKRASPEIPCDDGDRPLTIGFCGSFYAQREWAALLSALTKCHWRIAGRAVHIRVVGSFLPPLPSLPLQLEVLGWRGQAETVRLLEETDIAYLPYWLDPAYEEAVQLSFPSKLAAYVAARVPVLFHGPRESSPMHFFERFPLGLGCHTLDEGQIVQTLERLASDEVFRQRAEIACDEAYHQELCPAVFRRRFAQLIGVEEDDLLAEGAA